MQPSSTYETTSMLQLISFFTLKIVVESYFFHIIVYIHNMGSFEVFHRQVKKWFERYVSSNLLFLYTLYLLNIYCCIISGLHQYFRRKTSNKSLHMQIGKKCITPTYDLPLSMKNIDKWEVNILKNHLSLRLSCNFSVLQNRNFPIFVLSVS